MYKIPTTWGLRREPRINESQRKNLYTFGLSFDEQYDWDILFADAIRVSPNQVLLIGAPLYELKEILQFTDGGKVIEHQVYDLDRVSITSVLTQSNSFYLRDLRIDAVDRSDKFSGIGCITTMQKNEPFHWIIDWIKFHYKEHGVRGFVIYNNNSTDYTTEELVEELNTLELDIVFEVVDWSMPYGPETPRWDSDFSRYIMYEHFKYKYGWCCKYVLNQDVDEFFLVDGGKLEDVYEFLIDSDYSGIIYGNRNIDPYNESLDCSSKDLNVSERHFKDYFYYTDKTNSLEMWGGTWAISKWLTIPERSFNYQWRNHDIPGSNSIVTDKSSWQIYFAHFYAMQSKNQLHNPIHRDRNVSKDTTHNLKVDSLLKQKLKEIF